MKIRGRVEDWFEQHLGAPAQVTDARDVEGRRNASFRVGTYLDQPVEDAFTLATIGLSDTPQRGPSAERVRQELLLCAWNGFRHDSFYATLFTAAQLIHDSGETANPGEVIEMPLPVAEGVALRHLFVYLPIYHSDDLHAVPLGNGKKDDEAVEVLWLIPITAAEAAFIEENGPEAFDQLLGREDPDLMDLERPSLL
jgi:hypothetical protein